jgi:hypothetical protein
MHVTTTAARDAMKQPAQESHLSATKTTTTTTVTTTVILLYGVAAASPDPYRHYRHCRARRYY